MQHLFTVWQDFTKDARAASHILLLADYDGTITPIANRPEEAALTDSVRRKLEQLAGKPGISTGIISGRSLAEVKSIAAIEGIYYSGNHGLEIEGPGLSYLNPQAAAARPVFKALARDLEAALKDITGVIVQEKGLSVSVHYRLVLKDREKAVAEIVRRLTLPLIAGGKIRVFAMKKLWEIRPPVEWDKGKAVETIAGEIIKTRKIKSLLTVFLGDDTTDEDAFRVVRRPSGWSVFVGGAKEDSAAEYYLDSPAEVEEFLARLIELK